MEPNTTGSQTTKTDKEEQFELIFKNGALANLKKLAGRLGVAEDNLGEAVNKSIKLLSTVKNVDTETLTLETKDKKRYVLDVNNL